MDLFGGGGSKGIVFGPNGGISTDLLNSDGFIQLIALEGAAGSDGAQPFQLKTGASYRVTAGKKFECFMLMSTSATAGLRFGLAYSTASVARNAATMPAVATFESGTNGLYLHRTVAGTQFEPIIFSFPALVYPACVMALTTTMAISVFGREVDE